MRRVHQQHRARRVARFFAVSLLILLILSILLFWTLPSMNEFLATPSLLGCYKEDALLVFAKCRGTGVLKIAREVFLNLWLYLTVFQVFAFMAVTQLREPLWALIVLVAGVVSWALLIFLLFDACMAIVARLKR